MGILELRTTITVKKKVSMGRLKSRAAKAEKIFGELEDRIEMIHLNNREKGVEKSITWGPMGLQHKI